MEVKDKDDSLGRMEIFVSAWVRTEHELRNFFEINREKHEEVDCGSAYVPYFVTDVFKQPVPGPSMFLVWAR